jgi:hypothetical protein
MLFYPREGWMDVRDLSAGPDPLWLREINVPFHLEHVRNLLYVQINKVGDSPDETLAHFAQRLHDEIATTAPDKVAIDLRQNRGGDGTLIVPFIRSIIQSERIDRPGHLFAIIGPATFSAAQMLNDALEKYTNIILSESQAGRREIPTATREKSYCQTAASRSASRFTTGRTGIPWTSGTQPSPKFPPRSRSKPIAIKPILHWKRSLRIEMGQGISPAGCRSPPVPAARVWRNSALLTPAAPQITSAPKVISARGRLDRLETRLGLGILIASISVA